MHVCIIALTVDGPLIAAGALGVLAASVHGAGGELLVVRKLSPEHLPPSRFGGPRMTLAMIHVSWDIATVAFLTGALALLLAGTVIDGDGARAAAVVGACLFTGSAAIAVALGAGYMGSPRYLFRHPGPVALTLTAALAWWGAL
jgi:hypothetical protein